MDYQYLEVQKDEAVVICYINRPPANSINIQLMMELENVAKNFAANDDESVLIYTSKLPHLFMAGADIQMINDNWESINHVIARFQDLGNYIATVPKPIIAAINNLAAGGGLEFALACDFRFIAKEKGKISLPEAKLGLIPGGSGTQRIVRLLGRTRAMEFLMLGETYSAAQALELGIANKVFDDEQLIPETIKFAKKLSTYPRVAIAGIKTCVNDGGNMALAEGLQLERQVMAKVAASEDGLEGVQAFLQKRKPVFKNK